MSENTPIEPTPENPTNVGQPPISKPAVKSTKLIFAVVAIVLVAVAAVAAGWAIQQKSNSEKSITESNLKLAEIDKQKESLKQELEARKATTGEVNIDKDAFQAVFLKGGQVYFGKITSISETQITLEDIYYLRTNGNGAAFPSDAADVSLVKLGNELHGPQDKMFIERKEVEYWENLKGDSQVSKAIAEYKKANP